MEVMTQKRKVVIHNMKWFREAMKFSAKHIPAGNRTLKDCIKSLLRGAYDGEELHLRPDFVTHSFIFAYQTPDQSCKGYKQGMWGGIILHGFEQTLSVDLSAESRPHYSIHT